MIGFQPFFESSLCLSWSEKLSLGDLPSQLRSLEAATGPAYRGMDIRRRAQYATCCKIAVLRNDPFVRTDKEKRKYLMEMLRAWHPDKAASEGYGELVKDINTVLTQSKSSSILDGLRVGLSSPFCKETGMFV